MVNENDIIEFDGVLYEDLGNGRMRQVIEVTTLGQIEPNLIPSGVDSVPIPEVHAQYDPLQEINDKLDTILEIVTKLKSGRRL